MAEHPVFARFGAQLGEIAWHTHTVDENLETVSRNHNRVIEPYLKQYKTRRFLEVAPYAHFTSELLAADIEPTLCDISPHSLRKGQRAAREAGLQPRSNLVAADFHDLPFNDAAFDFVFIASALHHTRTPQRVIDECLRVLARSGVLFIFNEPCKRSFSFGMFKGNRKGALLPAERLLEERGILRLVTSFLCHSRPESLFFMVENDEIRVTEYLDKFRDHESLELRLDYKTWLTDFDKKIIECARAAISEAQLTCDIEGEIKRRLEGIAVSDFEQRVGLRLPDRAEIEALARRIASRLRGAVRTQAMEKLIDVFGGSIRAVVRKQTGAPLSDSVVLEGCELNQGVWTRRIESDGLRLHLERFLLPDIRDSSDEVLSNFFPVGCWSRSADRALIMRGPTATVSLPVGEHLSVVVLRFFTPCQDQIPYKVLVTDVENRLLADEVMVAQSESRLLRFIALSGQQIRISVYDLNGKAMYRQIQMPVCQVVPLEH